ncbi:TetR/AcrR family transcriptional regulator [Actinocorallia aurantiaca]|uniref:TetR/AcrR family transcriptional regulator n=1 Tax=Actinocorallia aurantiaca TaxID=46204 RepID=UPI0031D68711
MPRHADPVQRRRQVAEALFRVVEAEGLEAASIPRIARELGASTGLVQTYFRSKDELLLFAVAHQGDLLRARVAAALAETAAAGLKDRLLRAMCVVAGAGGESTAEGRIWLAFLARAACHPELRLVHVAGAREIREHCRSTLVAARSEGLVPAGLDVDAEARALAVLADGLAVQRAVEPEVFTVRVVHDLLRAHLDRIFVHGTESRA